jgi:hypothetical protein
MSSTPIGRVASSPSVKLKINELHFPQRDLCRSTRRSWCWRRLQQHTSRRWKSYKEFYISADGNCWFRLKHEYLRSQISKIVAVSAPSQGAVNLIIYEQLQS